jgi:hypothetical protein
MKGIGFTLTFINELALSMRVHLAVAFLPKMKSIARVISLAVKMELHEMLL